MFERIEPHFPTVEEAKLHPELVYSDHLEISARVPLYQKNEKDADTDINIISLNVLGWSGASGLHDKQSWENDEQVTARYKQLITGLIANIKRCNTDAIFLQETQADQYANFILPILQEQLEAEQPGEWEIINDNKIITCYKKSRFEAKHREYDLAWMPEQPDEQLEEGKIYLKKITRKEQQGKKLVDVTRIAYSVITPQNETVTGVIDGIRPPASFDRDALEQFNRGDLEQLNCDDEVEQLKKELKKQISKLKEEILSCTTLRGHTLSSVYFARERIRSVPLYDTKTGKLVNLSNVWGNYEHFPDNIEENYKKLLKNIPVSVSIIAGDTNSRIAPIDSKQRNITTGVVPILAPVLLDDEIVITPKEWEYDLVLLDPAQFIMQKQLAEGQLAIAVCDNLLQYSVIGPRQKLIFGAIGNDILRKQLGEERFLEFDTYLKNQDLLQLKTFLKDILAITSAGKHTFSREQVPDHPDGCLVCYRDDLYQPIYQVDHSILSFTGEEEPVASVADNQFSEELKTRLSEYRMVICLDEHFKKTNYINNMTIFEYEETLREAVEDDSIIVRMATNCMNDKAIAVRFSPDKKDIYGDICRELKDHPGVQFRNRNRQKGDHCGCIFVPLAQVDLLHQALMKYIPEEQKRILEQKQVRKTVLQEALTKYQTTTFSMLKEKYQSMSAPRLLSLDFFKWLFFRSSLPKVQVLKNIYDQVMQPLKIEIGEVSLERQIGDELEKKKDSLNRQWLEVVQQCQQEKGEIINAHRNRFFKLKRDNVSTATQLMLGEIKNKLQSP